MNEHQTDVDHMPANDVVLAERDSRRVDYVAGKQEEHEARETQGLPDEKGETVLARAEEQKTTATSEMISEAARQMTRLRKLRRAVVLASTVCIALGTGRFVLHLLDGSLELPIRAPIAAVILGFVGLYGLAVAMSIRPSRNSTIHRLWASEDITEVGPLAEATQMFMGSVTLKAMGALIRLLPCMKPEDGEHLTAYQRLCLRHLLGSSENGILLRPTPRGFRGYLQDALPRVFGHLFSYRRTVYPLQEGPLAEAILQALAQIGTADDLPIVRRLAAGGGIARRSMAIREAAQKCLPLIEERLATSRSTDHLLRPSGAPSSPDDVLLRAVSGGAEVSGEELMRPDSKP